jgi:hypothetical protein
MKSYDDIKEMSPNLLVSWFMMASYAYYRLGDASQIMSDQTFDFLVQRLKENYDLSDHPHKAHITDEHLNAGTGYDIVYPTIVGHAVWDYLRGIE